MNLLLFEHMSDKVALVASGSIELTAIDLVKQSFESEISDNLMGKYRGLGSHDVELVVSVFSFLSASGMPA